VEKIECSNHAVKCFRGSVEKLAKDNPSFKGRNALTGGKIQQMASRMKYAIAQSNSSRDISALRQDLCNCPRHCFGDHRRCRPSICNHASEGDEGEKESHVNIKSRIHNICMGRVSNQSKLSKGAAASNISTFREVSSCQHQSLPIKSYRGVHMIKMNLQQYFCTGHTGR